MIERLAGVLQSMGRVAVAVSGGVDSLTLAAFAHRRCDRAVMFHAVSPAVPEEATLRVADFARREGWRLYRFNAGEFDDARYRANPVDRCFHCKTHLYAAIAAAVAAGTQIVSGTNLDDLGEYRPGLLAARDHGVRHPFVEAAIDKHGVRAIARELGLGKYAELPAAPCLSSRIETGIAIEPRQLARVHAVEKLVGERLRPDTVRCRVRASGLAIELDQRSLGTLTDAERQALCIDVQACAGTAGRVSFEPYRNGSAFLVAERPR